MTMFERRYVNAHFEVRKAAADAPTVVAGHGAVFNKRSQKLFEPRLGPFIEQVAPGAFTKTIKETDVRALFNHDPNLILGRTSAETLRVAEDNIGLAYDFDVPDTSYGRDLEVSMARRDVTQSSFSFGVVGADGDTWSVTEDNFPLRTLNELRVGDVSPVTYPAYLDADTGLRQSLAHLAERRSISVDEAVSITRSGQLAPFIQGKRIDKRQISRRSIADQTFNDRQQLVEDAITKMLDDPDDAYCWIRDMTETWAVYEAYGTNPGTFRVDYTIGDDGAVTLGTPEAVTAVTTYTSVATGGRSFSAPGQTPTPDVTLATRRLELLRRRYPAA